MKLYGLTVLLSTLAVASFSSCDDDDKSDDKTPTQTNVPEAVVNTFTKQYPEAKNVSWDSKKTGYYVAEFDRQYNVEVEAWYKKTNGTWAMTSTDYGVDLFLVPAPIDVAFTKSEYSTWEIENVTYYEYPDSAKNFYLYEVEKKGQPDAAVVIYDDGTTRSIASWNDADITPDTQI